ncbi:MAG: hypothetical protein K0A89_02735 [ANME-2 cluster archaeon]|nr:hypothetical protein [ANME-2 cluster archaeon]MCL7475242.1 hypothetical protein [ANME-2 cluster archaeon]MDW7775051.1 hypothetical protein [Methanosarcinales archaeon]
MEIVREYQKREFCRDIRCPSQLKINVAPDQMAIDVVRKEECQKCKAHEFHAWLIDRDYQIVIIE